MQIIGNLICLTPRDSYVVDEPIRRPILRRVEDWAGPLIRSPGIGFAFMVGFFRKEGIIDERTQVIVQHDRIEGATPFTEIVERKVDLARGHHDVLFITAYTNSAREAYRRAREARAAYAAAGKPLTVVLGGAHASAMTDEGTRLGHVDAVVAGEGEWAGAELLNDIRQGKQVRPLYRAPFQRIRDRGSLILDMDIWKGLDPKPQQIISSATLARGCKLDCHFCAVKLTSGSTIRNRDLDDVVAEIESQRPDYDRNTIKEAPSSFYNSALKLLVKLPWIGRRYGDWLIHQVGPGFTDQVFFWDDNLFNAPGTLKALCEALRPLNRRWGAQMTVDIAEKPELLKLAYQSGCRDLFLGIESVNQSALEGIDKLSISAGKMEEMVKRVHDAGIQVLGAFVFGLDGDSPSVFGRTLDFVYKTGIDFAVANIIQPYPGTRTFLDAVNNKTFLPWAACPSEADVAMDYNWPLFDGAHVLVQPDGMTAEQLQEGYYYFLREAYSMSGILRRFHGTAFDLKKKISHFSRNYMVSRYGMSKTAHAIRRKTSDPVGFEKGAMGHKPEDAVVHADVMV